jgi:hypothetical protein
MDAFPDLARIQSGRAYCFDTRKTRGAAMTEEPVIIEMNIAHYEALLKLDLDDGKRSTVNRLLAEAKEKLALTAGLRRSQ